MKRQFTSFIMGAALSAVAGTTLVSAQDKREVADVHFAYQATGRTLQPGTSVVKQVNDAGLYQVSDSSGNSVFWSGSKQVRANPAKPHLKFVCYAKGCSLDEIAMPGSTVAYKLSQPANEGQFSRKIGIATVISVPLR